MNTGSCRYHDIPSISLWLTNFYTGLRDALLSKTKIELPDMDNEAKITLGLLNMVHDNEHASQRSMADGLGIALGLANAYLKRCVKKG